MRNKGAKSPRNNKNMNKTNAIRTASKNVIDIQRTVKRNYSYLGMSVANFYNKYNSENDLNGGICIIDRLA